MGKEESASVGAKKLLRGGRDSTSLLRIASNILNLANHSIHPPSQIEMWNASQKE